MIDFVPLPLYTLIFNLSVLFLVIVATSQCFTNSVFTDSARLFSNIATPIIALLIIFYMGLRPVTSYYFGDTINYANSFFLLQMRGGGEIEWFGEGEWVFYNIMTLFAKYGNIHSFFLFCAAVYVGMLWWALKRIFREDYFIPFVVAISMFTFWSYGVNGIRNGMASSVIILALTYRQKWPVAILLSVIAFSIHKSMGLTIFAALLAMFIAKPKVFLFLWIASIPLSLVAGGGIANILTESGLISDNRFASYIQGDTRDIFSHVGFRWDFLLYSTIPVLIGSYFIFRRKYTDPFFIWLFNIYLTTNAFWIIVIRANFSNRFAQLSWFIMPLVLIYPFFMKKFWDDQQARTGWVVIIGYLYTFYSGILRL